MCDDRTRKNQRLDRWFGNVCVCENSDWIAVFVCVHKTPFLSPCGKCTLIILYFASAFWLQTLNVSILCCLLQKWRPAFFELHIFAALADKTRFAFGTLQWHTTLASQHASVISSWHRHAAVAHEASFQHLRDCSSPSPFCRSASGDGTALGSEFRRASW